MVARKTAMVAPRLFQRTESSDQAATPVDTTPRPTGRPRKKNVRPLHTLTSISDWERAFSTRKRTLMSKAYELEVATGSVVTITVHAPTGEIHYYANDDVHVEGLKKAKLVSDDSKRYTQHYFSDQVTNRISMIQNLFRSRNLDPEASQTATALPTTSTPQPTRAATVPTLLPTVTDKSSPNRTATSANDGVSQASPHTNGNLNKLPSPAGVSVQSEVSSADQTPETAASVTNPSNTVSPRASSVHPRKNTRSSADGSQNSETKGRQTVSPRAERVYRGEADISPFSPVKRDRFPANAIRPSPVSTTKSPKINVTVLSPVAQVQSYNAEESTDSDSSESSESTTSSEDSDSTSSEQNNAAPSDFIPLSQLNPVSKVKSYISPFLSPTVARANVVPLPFSPRADSVVDLTEPEHFKAVESMLQLPPDVTRMSAASTEDNPYSFNHLLSPSKTPAVNRSSPLYSDGTCKKKAVKSKNTGSQSTSVDSPLDSGNQCKKTVVKGKTTVRRDTSVDSPLGSDKHREKKRFRTKKTVTSICWRSVGSSLGTGGQGKKKTAKTKTTGSLNTSVCRPLDSKGQCKKKSVKSKKTGNHSARVKSKLKPSTNPPKAKNVESESKKVVGLRPKTGQTRGTQKSRPNSSSNATTSTEKLPKMKRTLGKSNKKQTLYGLSKRPRFNEDLPLPYEHQRENAPVDPAKLPTREELCKQVRDEFDEKLSVNFLAKDEQLYQYVTKIESRRLQMCPITMLHQLTAFENLALDIKRHTGHFTKYQYKTFLREALFQSNKIHVLGNVQIRRKAKRSKPIQISPIQKKGSHSVGLEQLMRKTAKL